MAQIQCFTRFWTLACILLPLVVGQITDCQWPSPAEIYALNDVLDGEVVLPGSEEYTNETLIGWKNFPSDFLGGVIFVESVDDVLIAVDFARENGLPVSVLSSAHCFIGRSAGYNTLRINMSRMKAMSVDLEDPDWPSGSITVQTGNTWGDIYEEVDRYGKVVVGGSSPSVSPGGYLVGGGHSPLSRALGLGVDSLIEIVIVTTDGKLRSVKNDSVNIINGDGSLTPDEESDLWWSLRGGGHGMGIVTSYRYMMHDAPESFFHISMMYPIRHPLFGWVGDQILDHYSKQLLEWPDTWGGFLIMGNVEYPTGIPDINYGGYIMVSMLHYGPQEEGWPSIQPLYDFHPEWSLFRAATNYSTFWEYQKTIVDPIGDNLYIGTRFMQAEDFADSSRFRSTVMSMMDHATYMACTGVLLGGATGAVDTSASAVSEDFRNGLMSLACGTGWEPDIWEDLYVSLLRDWFDKHLYTIGKGQYVNEPDYYYANWKQEYWGSQENYDRLLLTKNKYDPDNMFNCHLCVGNDK